MRYTVAVKKSVNVLFLHCNDHETMRTVIIPGQINTKNDIHLRFSRNFIHSYLILTIFSPIHCMASVLELVK